MKLKKLAFAGIKASAVAALIGGGAFLGAGAGCQENQCSTCTAGEMSDDGDKSCGGDKNCGGDKKCGGDKQCGGDKKCGGDK